MPLEGNKFLTEIDPRYWRRYFSSAVLREPAGRLAAQRRLLKILAALAGLGVILALLAGLFLPPSAQAREPGFCLSCHLGGPEYTLGAVAWQGPIYGEQEVLCPVLKMTKQELFLTESRLSALSLAAWRQRSEGLDNAASQAELEKLVARFRVALARPVHSGREIGETLQDIRRELDLLVYKPLREGEQRHKAWIWVGAIFLAMFLALLAALAGYRRLLPREKAAGRGQANGGGPSGSMPPADILKIDREGDGR